jgi:hypothetical protein
MKVAEVAKMMYEVMDKTKAISRLYVSEEDCVKFLNTLEALRPADKYVTTVASSNGSVYSISDYRLDPRLEFLAHPRAVMHTPTNLFLGKDLLVHEQSSLTDVFTPGEFEEFQYGLFNEYKTVPNPVSVTSSAVGLDTIKVFLCDGMVYNSTPTEVDTLPVELTITSELFERQAFMMPEQDYYKQVMLAKFGNLKNKAAGGQKSVPPQDK